MSDARRRELERQAALGDRAARAAWLLERVRAGEVSPADLRLAVTCGEEAALQVLGERSPGAEHRTPSPGWTASELERLEPRAGLRAAHAVLAWSLPRSDGPGPVRARPLLEATGAWLDEPTAAREGALAAALAALEAEPPPVVAAARELGLAALEPGSRLERVARAVAICGEILREWAGAWPRLDEAVGRVIHQAIVPARLGLPPVPPPDGLPPLCDYRVRAVEGHAHGGPFELEQDTTWEVVHRPSGAVVLSFAGEYSASYDGSGWSNGSWSGVSDVRLAADGRSVLVSEGGSSPRRVPIPDA